MHAVLTSLGGEGAPASVAVADDEVPELLVLLRRPQALPVLHLRLLASLARHGLIGGGEMSRTGQGERWQRGVAEERRLGVRLHCGVGLRWREGRVLIERRSL
jgi:hypothetical protein